MIDPEEFTADFLCNLYTASAAMQEFRQARSDLCELPTSGSTKRELVFPANDTVGSLLPDDLSVQIWKRRFTSFGYPNGRGGRPHFTTALAGVLNGELSFHYARWLQSTYYRTNEVYLEVAYWIGPTVNVAPSQDILDRYRDMRHNIAQDRWVIFHIHIPIDRNTFTQVGPGASGYRVGATAINVYHGQRVMTYQNANSRVDGRSTSLLPPQQITFPQSSSESQLFLLTRIPNLSDAKRIRRRREPCQYRPPMGL